MGMTPKEKKSRNNGFAHEKASSRIHPDGRSSGATLGNYGRRELDQVKYIATIEGHLIHLPLFHYCPHCRR